MHCIALLKSLLGHRPLQNGMLLFACPMNAVSGKGKFAGKNYEKLLDCHNELRTFLLRGTLESLLPKLDGPLEKIVIIEDSGNQQL